MREVAFATVVLLAILVAVGLPSATVLRRRVDGWAALTVDALLHGLVWIPLAVTGWAWLGAFGLGAVLLAWGAGVAMLATGRSPLPSLRSPRPDRGTVVLGVAWVLVLAVAGLLRLNEVNFLPWLGDMGAYVNWANEFVRTGSLNATWPPLFPAFLAVASQLFGTEHTTIGMTAVGLALVVGVPRLVHQLGGGRGAALAAGATTALSLHAVWYSTFPASESLVAPLTVLWVSLVHRALTAGAANDRIWAASGVGVTMLALGMLRSSAGLLLPPLLLAVACALVVPAWRRWVAPLAWVTFASAIASAVTLWYGIARIHKYFVDTQLKSMLPRPLWSFLDENGAFEADVRVALGLLLGLALLGLLARRLARLPVPTGPLNEGRGLARSILLLLALGLLLVVSWQVAVGGEVGQILLRISPVLVVGAVLGSAAAGRERSGAVQLPVLLMGSTSVVFLALHASRLGSARDHSFYLYWDRYLVSEVLPFVIVLTFLGVGWGARRLVAERRAGRLGTRAPRATVGLASLVVVALAVVPGIPALRLAGSDAFLRGAYALTSEAVDLAAMGSGPVYWGSDAAATVTGYTAFPNTWMAIAVPMERTFGVDVFNVSRGTTKDFEPDDLLLPQEIPYVAACAEVSEYVLLEVSTGGQPADERLARPDVVIEPLGTVEEPVLFLAQPAGDRGWYSVDFLVTAWQVSVEPSARVVSAPCWLSTEAGTGNVMARQ
ncbi:hypothetical protein [Actinotalea sp.]|uniref:hypothetical protein n=1 Tax=Actinotalea sp. TaxID=1872145 RepID=UPI003566426C